MQTNDDNGSRAPLEKMSPAVVQALAEAHAGLRQFVRRTLRTEEEADDVMHDFYLRVLARASQLRREESVRGWLRRVLRSVLNDHLRRQAARRRAEADFARKEAATPIVEGEIDKVVCMCLYKILPALRPEYAEVVRRVDLQDESREAVAEALGLSLGNVKVRLHRARRALRRLLELTCETCPIHGFLNCGCEYTRKLRSSQAIGTERAIGV